MKSFATGGLVNCETNEVELFMPSRVALTRVDGPSSITSYATLEEAEGFFTTLRMQISDKCPNIRAALKRAEDALKD
ncbi:hypothetical protein EN788_22270 [Mesorhizobium sp. M2D.F.Ca.ET.145.01.1.1]|uniref:hypothetical protein n=1 Tax=unclassified Mesorhizobium TaxID=325217 RepID=UPI000FCBF983|nr:MULTISPECIES: hypothetical protein [unclassified Mesorhizobium]TGU44644.1 hypothetical protein EN789_21820 [bacterium M00.F.Ca.ET.146.01.1.1]TGU58472.1 hypothetical protein EN791_021820 [Mesorhizobium sp. M2D.F.Ca.ET.148.01.1.1]TGU64404.1 hypothetical protein EN790_21815 [Mesorhizobium sp. M2D.F.Ca.ET.147.01.1.1]TGW09980.1 hypothetical protein EN788_22270 [Mesorhizobium sp. M2D.F.Ca.ET.145.01.1.1]